MCDLPSENLCDGVDNIKTEVEESVIFYSGPNFATVPLEIFLHICTYLDATCLSSVLRNVCQRFNDILCDDNVWRLFVQHKTLPHAYPALPSIASCDDYTWEKAFVQMDKEEKIWKEMIDNIKNTFLKEAHYSLVDTVILMNNGKTCISGSRDHCLTIWDMEKASSTSDASIVPLCINVNAHNGWIWDLAYNNSNLYSCSWDNTVKYWDVGTELTCIDTYKCTRIPLSVICDSHIFAVGSYSKQVLMFDHRNPTKCICKYTAHTGPVLTLAMSEYYIFSGSEDRTVSVWDRRTHKILKQGIQISDIQKPFPMCMSYSSGCLYIGDSSSNICLMDPMNFSITPYYRRPTESIYSSKSSGIKNNYGSVIASFDNGFIDILSPTNPTTEICQINTSMSQVTAFDYQSNVLVAVGDNGLELWFPPDFHF